MGEKGKKSQSEPKRDGNETETRQERGRGRGRGGRGEERRARGGRIYHTMGHGMLHRGVDNVVFVPPYCVGVVSV